MTRDLLIVSERALTASDLAAGVSAVHQGRPWAVTDNGDRLAVTHCDRPLLQASVSVRRDAGDGPIWHTELTVIDEQTTLAVEVARAVAWETGGSLVELPD